MRIRRIIFIGIFLALGDLIGHAQQVREISASTSDPESKRPDGGKYITVDEAILDLDEGDLTETIYASEGKRKRNRTARNLTNEQSFVEFSQSLAGQVMGELLKMGYLDTTGSFFPEYHNSLKLNVVVQEIHIDFIKPKNSLYYNEGYVELAVDFELRSHYGKELYKTSIRREKSMNGYVKRSFQTMSEILEILIEEFLSSSEVQSKVTYEGSFDLVEESNFSAINLPAVKPAVDIAEWQKAVVTVIGEKGHGSACVISTDGYIITNFHVIGQESKVKVKWMNGDVSEATVLRKHPDCDLALLKVEKSGLVALPFDSRVAKIGETVFVVGTPADTLLSQSVSRGIVSGIRENEGVSLIQTDAKVNGGNSGGALISADGRIIGVVSAKYVGYGVEGLGFAIPVSKLEEDLKVYTLKYTAPETPKTSSGKTGKKK